MTLSISDLLTTDRMSGKSYRAADGLLKFAADDVAARSWSPVNLLASEYAPAAQEITPGRLKVLTLRMTGTGRVKVTGVYEGTATQDQPLRIYTRSDEPLRIRPIGEVTWFGAFAQLGLGIHDDDTNGLLECRDFTAWNQGFVALTAGQAGGLDGTATKTKLRETTDDQQHRIWAVTSGSGQQCYEFIFAAVGRSYAQLQSYNATDGQLGLVRFDLTGQGAVDNELYGPDGAGIRKLGEGVWHCWIVASPTAATSWYLLVNDDSKSSTYAGDTAKGLDLLWAQVTAGNSPKPLILTEGGTASRVGDVVTTDLVLPEDFTVVIGPYSVAADGGFIFTFFNPDDHYGERLMLRFVSTQHQFFAYSGNALLGIIYSSNVHNFIEGVKVAVTRKNGVYAIAANGQSAGGATTLAANFPSGLTKLAIGHTGGTNILQQQGFTAGLQIINQGLSLDMLKVLSA